ncbi:hypothetical protein AGLY_002611 [Aphis glycines]|uniref:Uncharacterized protein n=1 Tax=Aphis glycines TaxID=307491 RepID=A0A6G0U1P1_APHGL|nr:hypothetical protein AGLY_002611 [Aphis glycines]
MDWMLYSIAASSHSSTSTFNMTTSGNKNLIITSMNGAINLHGPHHLAKKSMMTNFSLASLPDRPAKYKIYINIKNILESIINLNIIDYYNLFNHFNIIINQQNKIVNLKGTINFFSYQLNNIPSYSSNYHSLGISTFSGGGGWYTGLAYLDMWTAACARTVRQRTTRLTKCCSDRRIFEPRHGVGRFERFVDARW